VWGRVDRPCELAVVGLAAERFDVAESPRAAVGFAIISDLRV
jgi:hypothetical protein